MLQLLTLQHKRMHTMSRFYCTIIFYIVSIYAGSPLCATLWSYYRPERLNTTVHHVLHMEEDFYGLTIRSSLKHYLVFAVTMALTSYVCAFVSTTKIVTVFNLTNYCTVYFQLVALKLQNEAQSRMDCSSVSAIVKMHQQALQCANLLETIVSPLMLMQSILCILMTSSTLYYFIFADFNAHMINVFMIFLVVTTETFGYCYLGTRLSMESAHIAHIANSANWERQSNEMAKHLQLILLRAQKQVGITAGKFFYIDMEQFTAVH
uniref:Odorant receptor n=1 Tax=Anopheles funestus TaxID=62324 RepID=A0A182S573_ANOFN